MKKVIFSAIFACVALSSVEVNAQTAKGDIWLGGSSNLGLTFTPDFTISTSFTADYFLMDRLSVGAQVYVGVMPQQTYVGLSPRVQYFITQSIYANLDANVLQVNPGEKFGIEVKTSKGDGWKTLGGSIMESTRVDDVSKVSVLFGKLNPFLVNMVQIIPAIYTKSTVYIKPNGVIIDNVGIYPNMISGSHYSF